MTLKVEDIFSFEYDDFHGDYFTFYYVYDTGKHFSMSARYWTEDTVISIFSHEAIEMLLAVIEIEDNMRCALHQIIGVYDEYKEHCDVERTLCDAHYADNVDGLPNLPKSLYIEKDIEMLE